MPALDTAMIVLAAIALLAAFVNGAIGYGFSSLTVPVALVFLTNRILNPAIVLVEVILNLYVLFINRNGVPAVWRRVFPILIGLLPGIAAVLTGYTERLALKAQARQYDRMRGLFERAYDLLPPEIGDGSTVLAHGLYRELGMEAMKEQAEWVAIYRQRPIEPLRG